MEEDRIGKRYRVSYDDFLPSLYPLYNERLKEKKNFTYEYLDDYFRIYRPTWDRYYYFMYGIYDAVVEYIGNGLCRDLVTGIIVRENYTSDVSESVEVPLCLYSGLHNSVNDNHYPKYTDEDIRIITDSVNLYSDIVLDQLLDYASQDEKDVIERKRKQLDQERINRVFSFPYWHLSAVMHNQHFVSNSSFKEFNTLVVYLGNGLYKDLITNHVYQDREFSGIHFGHNGQKSNAEEYLRAMLYPIHIDRDYIDPVKDSAIIDIWNNRDEIDSKVSNQIQFNIDNLRVICRIMCDRKLEDEYSQLSHMPNDDSLQGIVKSLSIKH